MKLASALIACAGSAAAILSSTLLMTSGNSASATTPVAATPVEPVAPFAGAGTIKGKVVLKGDAPAMPEIDTKGKQFCETLKVVNKAVLVDPKSKGVANVIVWVVAPKGKNPEAEKALLAKTPIVKVDNHNCEFLPRSTAMSTSQKLQFTSSDNVGHNSHVTSLSTYACNLALPPNGKADAPPVQADKRPMKLVCDIHGWMEGNILVVNHPYFAVTGEDGSFTITGVPADTQNVIIWHEKAGFISTGGLKGQPVVVKADGVADLGDVTLDASKIKK